MHTLHMYHLSLNFPTKNHYPTLQNGRKNSTSRKLHNNLLNEDVFSDALNSLRISIENENPKLGSCFHAKILKQGLQNYIFVANSLLDMYVKCGLIGNAANLFDQMSHKNVVSWTSMMSCYCQEGFPEKVLKMYTRMLENLQPNEYVLAVVLQACGQIGVGEFAEFIHGYSVKCGYIADRYLQICLLGAYAKCGMLDVAELLSGMFSSRDVVSWTMLISACVKAKMVERAFSLFYRMQDEGVMPNEVTFLSILQASSQTKSRKIFQCGHGLVLKGGWCANELIMNSLVEMYCANGCFNEGIQIFREFSFMNTGLYLAAETVANLIHGLVDSGLFKLGKEVHGYIIKHGYVPSTVVENSLMNLYAENRDDNSTLLIFTRIRTKDIVSWNTMIGCFVKNEHPSEALKFLTVLHRDGPEVKVSPDFITILASLSACSDLASLERGQSIHGYILKTGLLQDIFVQNSVIDMYAKSGRLDLAEKAFKQMHERDVGSWNSMIAAYGINGDGTSALRLFADLNNSKVSKPNAITFTNTLSACAHAGLVEEGLEIFNHMDRDHAFEPCTEHLSCIVDLLGRSGRIQEAETFIKRMPHDSSPDLWGALLGACVHKGGNIEIAERAARVLSILEPENGNWRVALSNVYASVGRWHDVSKIRSEIRGSKQLKKEGGWSIVDIQGCPYRFMVGDTKHPNSRMIYEVLSMLHCQLRDSTVNNTFVY